jgi:hypothetical protein
MGTPTPQELRDELARVRSGAKAWERRFELEAARRQQALDDAARTHDSLEIWKATATSMEAKAERERLKVVELTEKWKKWFRLASKAAAEVEGLRERVKYLEGRVPADDVQELQAEIAEIRRGWQEQTAVFALERAALERLRLRELRWQRAYEGHTDLTLKEVYDESRAALDPRSSSPVLDQPDPPLWQQTVVRSQGMCGALVMGDDGRTAVCILQPGHDPAHALAKEEADA